MRSRDVVGRALAAALGFVLLVILIRRVGLSILVGTVRDVGWGFPAILLLYCAVIGVTLQSWRELLHAHGDAPVLPLLRIKLIADAFNALTPLGTVGGEPYRVAASSRWYGRRVALQSVIVDRLLDQAAAAALMIVAGLSALSLPSATTSLGTAGAGVPASSHWFVKLRELASREQRTVLLRAFACRLTGRLLSVVEIAIILASLGFGFRWRVALVAVAVNIGVNGLFSWIPGALGASEAAITAAVAWAGVGAHVGLTVALIRRLRGLCWAAVGLVVLFTADRESGLRIQPQDTTQP